MIEMSTTGIITNPVLLHRIPSVWRTMALLALTVCVLALIPAASEQSDAESGKCGDNVSYEIVDFETLKITGSGAMYDYSSTNAPWASSFFITSAETVAAPAPVRATSRTSLAVLKLAARISVSHPAASKIC